MTKILCEMRIWYQLGLLKEGSKAKISSVKPSSDDLRYCLETPQTPGITVRVKSFVNPASRDALKVNELQA